jgi:hypothetical protein
LKDLIQSLPTTAETNKSADKPLDKVEKVADKPDRPELFVKKESDDPFYDQAFREDAYYY